MKETYNNILNNMRTAYFEECGYEPAPDSDLELRFKAVAGEIFSAYSYADFILKQVFPQTATGEYLDRHAAMRGIERKAAAVSQGVLEFSISEPLETDVLIPQSTVCSSAQRPFVQFATTEQAVIEAGETSVTVPVQALSGGAEFNCPAGEITVLVNPPEYVTSVTNTTAMTGGFDDENDASLRERLVSSYATRRFAVNESSLREQLLTSNYILDARVYNSGSESINVCIKAVGGYNAERLKSSIKSTLGLFSVCKLDFQVFDAEPFSFNINASIKLEDGYDNEELISTGVDVLSKAVSSMHIGQNVSKTELEALLYGIEGVTLAEVCLVDENGMPFSCPSNSYLVPDKITVAVYE